MTNVVASAIREELIADVQENKFFLIIEVTSDLSTSKQLCVIVHYYSNSEEKILASFVDLIPVVHTYADDLLTPSEIVLVQLTSTWWTVLATPAAVPL